MVATKTTTMKYNNTTTGSTNRAILKSVHSNASVGLPDVAAPTKSSQHQKQRNNQMKKSTTVRQGPEANEELQRAAFETLHAILLAGNDDRSTGNFTSNVVAATTAMRQWLNLFGAACSNRHVPVHLQPHLTMKDQHFVIFTALRNRAAATATKATKEFFQSLHRLIQYVISNVIVTSPSSLDDAMDTDAGDTVTPFSNAPRQLKEGYLFLHFATLCVTAFFEGLVAHNQHESLGKSNSILLEIFHIAETLHDFLDIVNDASISTEEANMSFQSITSLCEKWWTNNGYEKETIISNILPTVLGNVVGATDPKSSDIKRLYHLRTALSIIDYNDSESQSFVSLLLRITTSPVCIRHPDGKKFIAYLLSDPAFVSTESQTCVSSQVHQAIRVQIPNNQPSVVLHYGDIYYMAWKEVCTLEEDADQMRRSTWEMDVMSDFIYASIYAEQSSLVTLIHVLLSKWYNYYPSNTSLSNSANSDDRTQFLHRMYTPIIWRATVASNPLVRVNAIQTLLYIFPLSSSDNSNNSNITKACTTIQQLLQDPDMKVRCTTTQVATQLLLLYWDGIPARYIHMILNCIVSEHASDVTSSAVRIGAVNAITHLLDAPQSHGVLREILPAMGNLIHDKVEKVRLAVVQLLLKIKTTPQIKYYHIVPLEHLTARFMEEAKGRHPSKSIVAAALTSLMINSYFPDNSNKVTSINSDAPGNTEPIRRALQFCTDEPDAAIVFYSHVSKYRSFASIIQLLIQLFRCLHNTTTSTSESGSQRAKASRVAAAMKRRRRFSRTKSPEDASVSNDTSTGDTEAAYQSPPIDVLATIAEVIRTLLESIATKLQQNNEWNSFVTDEFSGSKLISIFTYYDNMAHNLSVTSTSDDDVDTESLLIQEDCYRICSAIVSCAGRLSTQSGKVLASSILKSIQHEIQFNVPCNVQINNSAAYITALICYWGMADQIVASFAATIRSSLYKKIMDDTNASFLGSPTTVFPDSKKRRSGRSIVSSKSRNVASDGDALTFPQLPASTIIHVLDVILAGSDSNNALARDAILSSTKASDDLEQLFHDGIKCMERTLNEMDIRTAPLMETSSFTDLVSICELYGRLILHKEASKSKEGSVTFTSAAKNLLFFTSSAVIPALQQHLSRSSHVVPFSDPNVSSIQMERSFVDTTLSSPQSPNPLWRPRRRINRNQTPQRLDGGIGIYHNSPDDTVSSGWSLSEIVLVPLFVNLCKLFSEWLIVSACSDTANFIKQAAIEWCPKVLSKSNVEESSLDMHYATLPPFLRLLGQLLSIPGNFSILNEVLNTISDDARSVDALQKVLYTILAPKANQSLMKGLVDCFLDVTYDSLPIELETAKLELPDAIDDDWTLSKRSLSCLLVAIMSHQQTCDTLATILMERFIVHVKQTSCPKLPAFFDLQCMWLLICDTSLCKITTGVMESVIRTVQQVDLSEIDDEKLQMLIEDFRSRVQ